MDAFIAIMDALPYILMGVAVTAGIVIGAMMLGLIAGIPTAVGQVYGSHPVRTVVGSLCLVFSGGARTGASFSGIFWCFRTH